MKIDNNNNEITSINNNSLRYLKVNNNKSTIKNYNTNIIKKSIYNIKNLYPNERINLTDNYLSQNDQINFKEKNKQLFFLSNFNLIKSDENKKDNIYKTFNEREKLKKLKIEKSSDSILKYNRIKKNKNTFQNYINNWQNKININIFNKNMHKSNSSYFLSDRNDIGRIKNYNSYLFKKVITSNQ